MEPRKASEKRLEEVVLGMTGRQEPQAVVHPDERVILEKQGPSRYHPRIQGKEREEEGQRKRTGDNYSYWAPYSLSPLICLSSSQC